MSKIASIEFEGESGRRYDFDVYMIDTAWKEDVSAVYVVTKRHQKDGGKYSHDKLYIGRTGCLKTKCAGHQRAGCFEKHGANCVCVHPVSDEVRGVDIEIDLLQANMTTCNEK